MVPYKSSAQKLEYNRQYRKTYIEPPNRVEYKRNWRKKQRAHNSKWISELKESLPCVDCGGLFSAECMDFDHIEDNKKHNIATMVRSYSKDRVLKEIEKCELVCSNCHRIRTKNRIT